MLCKDKITSIFCIIDDILKEINHSEDIRRKVSDSEIITTAFIAATNFYGNHRSAIKFVKRGFFQKLHPNRVINMTINKIPVQQSVVTNIVNFIFLYIAVLFVGTLLVALDGKDLVTSFSAVLTCLSNVGPGFNGVGPTMNFSGFSDYATLLLSFLMIAGRLELFTLLVLFSPRYWNSNRV